MSLLFFFGLLSLVTSRPQNLPPPVACQHRSHVSLPNEERVENFQLSSNRTCSRGRDMLTFNCTVLGDGYGSKYWLVFNGSQVCHHSGEQENTTTILQWPCEDIVLQCVFSLNGSKYGSHKIHVKPVEDVGTSEVATALGGESDTTLPIRNVEGTTREEGRHAFADGKVNKVQLRLMIFALCLSVLVL